MAEQTLSQSKPSTVPVPAPRHLGAIVRQLEADYDLGRLSRAVVVVLTSDIRQTAECGVYEVQSACQADTWYTTTTASCTCPDAVQRGRQQRDLSDRVRILGASRPGS